MLSGRLSISDCRAAATCCGITTLTLAGAQQWLRENDARILFGCYRDGGHQSLQPAQGCAFEWVSLLFILRYYDNGNQSVQPAQSCAFEWVSLLFSDVTMTTGTKVFKLCFRVSELTFFWRYYDNGNQSVLPAQSCACEWVGLLFFCAGNILRNDRNNLCVVFTILNWIWGKIVDYYSLISILHRIVNSFRITRDYIALYNFKTHLTSHFYGQNGENFIILTSTLQKFAPLWLRWKLLWGMCSWCSYYLPFK